MAGTYAKAWKSDPEHWSFLTGSVDQVRAVAALFGMNFWDDEGFWTHSFHTAVIDRDGRLVGNLEGNAIHIEATWRRSGKCPEQRSQDRQGETVEPAVVERLR